MGGRMIACGVAVADARRTRPQPPTITPARCSIGWIIVE
jgi:hypothetical protein